MRDCVIAWFINSKKESSKMKDGHGLSGNTTVRGAGKTFSTLDDNGVQIVLHKNDVIALAEHFSVDGKDIIKNLKKQRTVWYESFNTEMEDNNNLREEIKKLKGELESMTHTAKELHGVISEYSLMPCRSLETRMMSTANRYASRIFGVDNEPN